MIIIAPKSSMIASAAKNTFKAVGTRFPINESTPNAKAMSVAIGIPNPFDVVELKLKETYNKAGTSIPPNALITGKLAFLSEESSPSINSRFISKPINRKKTDINPSLIQCSSFKPAKEC